MQQREVRVNEVSECSRGIDKMDDKKATSTDAGKRKKTLILDSQSDTRTRI
jgi:hypothetical protein